MATNSLIVKDGNGTLSSLSTFSGSYGLIPEHAITGTVNVTASAASPVYVTGTVQVGQPINVDVVVGDLITVTSSMANPVYVSGNVEVADTYTNNGVTALYVRVTASSEDLIKVSTDVDKYAYPGGTLGAFVTRITASDGDPVHVTSSNIYPVNVSSSEDRPVFVVSSEGKPVYVSSSAGNWVQVTASHTSPTAVTSNESRPVFVVNNVGNSVFVTSSDSTPVITKAKLASSVTRNKFASGGGSPQIDWASTGSSNVSGTFILADSSSARVGLLFANNTSRDLYVAIGNGSYSTTNGFLLNGTGSAPVDYSFILYPSGTYSADPSFANAKHSGFFVSASNIDVTVTVVTTE